MDGVALRDAIRALAVQIAKKSSSPSVDGWAKEIELLADQVPGVAPAVIERRSGKDRRLGRDQVNPGRRGGNRRGSVKQYPDTPIVGRVVIITDAPANFDVSETYQLVAQVLSPEIPVADSFPQELVLTGRTVTWTSGTPATATIDNDGLVTAVAPGTTTIVARCEGVDSPGKVITVETPAGAVASNVVTPATFSINAGGTQILAASPRDASGNFLPGRTVTWGTSNGAIATVGADSGTDAHTCTVTAVAEGSVTITATCETIPGTSAGTIAAAATVDGPAELPRVTPSYTYAAPSGTVYTPATAAALNTLLTGGTLARGDIIQLAAGTIYTSATHQQQTFPAIAGTADLSDPESLVMVRSANHASLPASGARVDDGDLANMPIFRQQGGGGNPPIKFAASASGYVFVGIAVDAGSVTSSSRLVEAGVLTPTSLSQMLDKIVFERCHMSSVRTNRLTRCIYLNSRETVIKDCHLWAEGDLSLEGQAINGATFKGPMLVDNCLLVSGAENFMLGGVDPQLVGTQPEDITIRRCHIYKPLTWCSFDPSYAGVFVTSKNSFELKKGTRVLLEDCVIENFFPQGQKWAINLKSSNQSNTDPTSETQDIVIRFCKLLNVNAGINLSDVASDFGYPSVGTDRVSIHDLLMTGLGAAANGGSQGGSILNAEVDEASFRHNTCIQTTSGSASMPPDSVNPKWTGFVCENNIFQRSGLGIKGAGLGEGTATLNAAYGTGLYDFAGNGMIGFTAASYPAGNTHVTNTTNAKFVDYAGGDYSLAVDSPFQNVAVGGGDPGADIATLDTRTAGCITGVWS